MSPLKDVPLEAKIWLSKYDTSGSLQYKDEEKNEYVIMVMSSGRTVPWLMFFKDDKLELKEVMNPLN